MIQTQVICSCGFILLLLIFYFYLQVIVLEPEGKFIFNDNKFILKFSPVIIPVFAVSIWPLKSNSTMEHSTLSISCCMQPRMIKKRSKTSKIKEMVSFGLQTRLLGTSHTRSGYTGSQTTRRLRIKLLDVLKVLTIAHPDHSRYLTVQPYAL